MKTAKFASVLAGILAISSLNGFSQDLANFTLGLQGQYPGLFVIGRDAIPGSGSARMMVHGYGSYAEGIDNNTVKIFVDGFETQADFIAYLNPEEVESVTVLKDAASLALYGANGANGVILITTRKGMESSPVIKFQARTGLQTPINVAKPLRSLDYARLYNQAYANDHGREWEEYYDFEAINDYKTGAGTDVSWYDEVYKNTGSYSDASLVMTGGSNLAKYNVVLDYANQQGFLNVRNTDRTSNNTFVKYGLRTNIDMKLNRILTASVNIGGRLEDRSRPNYSLYDLAQDVMNYPSNIYPVMDAESTDPISRFSGTSVYPNNPVASMCGLGWTTSRTKLIQANFKFKEDLGSLLDGLYLEEGFSFYSKTIGNTAKTCNYARYYDGTAQTSDVSSYIRSQGYWSSGKERWMQGKVTMGWNGSFDRHDLSAALNAHISDYNGSGSEFYNWKYHYVNFSGAFTHTFDKKYISSLAFSYFGSDAYAKGNRFMFYPSASFTWLASEEDFLKGNGTITDLKATASVGTSGATEAYVGIEGFLTDGRYLYQQYYGWTGSFVTGLGPNFGGGESGLKPLFSANPGVTAEMSTKADLTVQAELYGKLKLEAGYFFDYRSGILTLDRTRLDAFGNDTFYSNMGRMINNGFDLSFVYTDKAGDFTYSVFGNVTFARNKVLEMGEVGIKNPYNAATGHPYGSRMGLECIGFYELKDFDMDGELNMGLPVSLFGDVQPGDLKYKDQDGNGFIDETDFVKVGNPAYPMAMFSIGAKAEWKRFDFALTLNGSAGSAVNLLDYRQWRTFEDHGNAFEWAKGAWVFYPEAKLDTRNTATYPRLTTEENKHNYAPSSFWVRKNNYLRLHNIEVGYSFKRARVYVNSCNPLTISPLLWKYKMDPETVNYGYPAARSFNAGVQFTF